MTWSPTSFSLSCDGASTSAAERSTRRLRPPTKPPGAGATGLATPAPVDGADFAAGADSAADDPLPGAAWSVLDPAESVAEPPADEGADDVLVVEPPLFSTDTATTSAIRIEAAAPSAAICGRVVSRAWMRPRRRGGKPAAT